MLGLLAFNLHHRVCRITEQLQLEGVLLGRIYEFGPLQKTDMFMVRLMLQ